MKTGDTLTELRAWRDEFARAHGFDVHAMAEALRALDGAGARKVIRGEPRRPRPVRSPNNLLQPTGPAIAASDNSQLPHAGPAAER
jgi:hypothetical protein